MRVNGIANEALRLDVELRFNPIDYRLGALNLFNRIGRFVPVAKVCCRPILLKKSDVQLT